MNTQFLFDNIIYFPILTVIVLAVYLIQFCSVISPCCIEFDGESKKEMDIMNRYNTLSENVFSIYLACIFAGVFVAVLMESSLILFLLMLIQLVYIIPVGFVMFSMYGRSKRYWGKKTLTLCEVDI